MCCSSRIACVVAPAPARAAAVELVAEAGYSAAWSGSPVYSSTLLHSNSCYFANAMPLKALPCQPVSSFLAVPSGVFWNAFGIASSSLGTQRPKRSFEQWSCKTLQGKPFGTDITFMLSCFCQAGQRWLRQDVQQVFMNAGGSASQGGPALSALDALAQKCCSAQSASRASCTALRLHPCSTGSGALCSTIGGRQCSSAARDFVLSSPGRLRRRCRPGRRCVSLCLGLCLCLRLCLCFFCVLNLLFQCS